MKHLKKILVALTIIVIGLTSFTVVPKKAATDNKATVATVSTTPTVSGPSANTLMVPLFKSGKSISLADFMHLTPSEYKTLTGEKMSFKERIELKLFQHHFKNAIAKDGTIDVNKFHHDMDDNDGFHLGWFLLGFLLGLIGLIIALCINDDNRHGRIKWTLIGWGVWVAIILIATVL